MEPPVSNGRLLQAIAVGHAVVGATVYRRELRELARRGLLGTISVRGDGATAFWFLVPAPLLFEAGRLLERSEQVGDAAALGEASWLGLGLGLAGAACMPISGFWGLAAVSLRGLRRARLLER